MLAIIKDLAYASTTNAPEGSENENMKRVFSEEIFNSFPSRSTFNASKPTGAILRKEIILLQFYEYFAKLRMNTASHEMHDFFEDFRSLTDAVLDECNLPILYAGNPFDWLFLYCATTEEPLDTFRYLMALGVE